MWTEAIPLLTNYPLRAICAAIAVFLLLGLCACTVTEISDPSAEPAPPTEAGDFIASLRGRWTGSYDVGDAVMRELGIDLTSRLRAPLLAEAALRFDPDGRCEFTGDARACAVLLRPVIADYVRELQESEAGESLSGLKLAEALGADPNDFADALCDELLPPPLSLGGRLDAGRGVILWDSGEISTLSEEYGALRVILPGLGDLCLRPEA